jgi:serpin B
MRDHAFTHVLTFAILAALVMTTAGCAVPSARPKKEETVIESRATRQEPTNVPKADLGTLVAGNNAFAFDLYGALRTDEDNLLTSPYSISLALAMTYAGARGETEQQMADTLHFALPQAQLHPAFNALDRALQGRGQGEQAFRVHLVNAIWGQRGYTFLDTFLDTLAQNYGAGLRTLDFALPEAARQVINDWVAEQTEKKIEDLLPRGALDASTVLVLANAIYFKAPWQSPFMEKWTQDGAFARLDGSQVAVPMMRVPARFGYVQGMGYQAVELPYGEGEMAMLILVPDRGAFTSFADTLDARRLDDILSSMQSTYLDLTMPKFSYASGFELGETLSAMGMPAAFVGADFTGMNGTGGIWIDDVYHKTFIAVDEQGTEAAAATAVVMERGLGAPLRIDRPFIYLIRDVDTGAILFVGQVLDPSG